MRQGQVFVKNQLVGIITEDETGYDFTYAQAYLDSDHPTPVSLTLPLSKKDYHSNVLFSFFDGLIPEGWMLNIAERNWKINRHDRMGLLLSCCRDCIGDISIVPIEQKETER
jgi:toxin-antitoxin system, toxin component, hipA family